MTTVTKSVRGLLQERIKTAITSSAVTSGVYAYNSAAYDHDDSCAPDKRPAVLVMMPEETSTESRSPDGLTVGQFTTDLLIFGTNANAETADSDMAELVNRVLVAVATWTPTNGCEIGIGTNGFQPSGESGWVVAGHDHCYRLTLTCTGFYSLGEMITVTVSP